MRTMPFAARCAFVVAVCFSVAARADDRPTSPDALGHYDKGKRLYEAGDFDKAAEEFKAGLLVEKAPALHYNLAECYWQLGNFKAAAYHYQRFIALHAADDKFRENARERLEEANAKAQATEPTPTPTQPPAPVSTPQLLPPAVVVSAEPDRWYQDGVGWGLLGTGLLAGTVSIVLLADASSLNDQANHSASQQAASALHDKADTRSLLGTVIGIGGAGLAITGAIKLAITPDAPRSRGTSWNVGAWSNGVLVFGRF